MLNRLQPLLPLFSLLVLIAVGYGVYEPGLKGPFLLDDAANIGPARLSALSWEEMRANAFSTDRLGGLSRSISTLTLGLSHHIHGAEASGFKRENLLLHLANGLLVFWLTRLLFLAIRPKGTLTASSAALAVAALWLLHPLQVSTVLYVVQRLVLLSAFFSLLALCLYVQGRLLAHRRPTAGTLLMLLGLAVIWPLGVLSKENAVLLVLVIPLLEWFVLRLRTHSARERRLLAVVLAVFVTAPLAVGLIYAGTHVDVLLAGYAGRDFSLTERLLTQAHVMWLYIGLILVPIPGNMSLFHDGFAVQRTLDLTTTIAITGIAAAVLLGFLLRRTAPLVGLGILWFFAWHLLESTVIPLELVFEHRNYLALMGVSLALVAAVMPVFARPTLRVPVAFGLLALAALLAMNTAARSFVWGDAELMARTDYETNASSPRLLEAMMAFAESRSDHDQALHYARQLQALIPGSAYPFLKEVRLLCDDPATAAAPLEQALVLAESGRVSPGSINVSRALLVRVFQGACPAVTENQMLTLAKALSENPRVHMSASTIAAQVTYAMAAMMAGDRETAANLARQFLAAGHAHSAGKFTDTVEAAAQMAAELPTRQEAIHFLEDVTSEYAEVLRDRGTRVYVRLPPEAGEQ